MTDFVHQRHKPPRSLAAPRELIVACPPMRSNVNLSRIVRTCGCLGIRRVIACGRPKIDRVIARDGAEVVQLEHHRTLAPVLRSFKAEGYRLVGMEQASNSQCLFDFQFHPRTVIVVGHERLGLEEEVLRILDHVVEIPVYGLPFSLNVASATDMALYEFCRQFPNG